MYIPHLQMLVSRAGRVFLPLLTVICCLAAFPSLASAQPTIEQTFMLTVSPATGFVKVQPGGLAAYSVTLRNQGETTVVVRPRLVDFNADGSTGYPVLSETSSFPYLANKEVLEKAIRIKPKHAETVQFSLSAPADAPTAEYRQTILFEQEPDDSLHGVSLLAPAIGSNMIVLVTDKQIPSKLQIETIQTPRWVDSLRPLVIKPIARNQTEAASVASGSAVIKDWRGRELYRYPIYPDIVLGQTGRELRAAKPAAPDPAAPTTEQTLEPTTFTIRRPMLLGAYTVEFLLEEQTPQGTVTSIQTFQITALPFVALLIVVSFALIGGVYYRVYRNKKIL